MVQMFALFLDPIIGNSPVIKDATQITSFTLSLGVNPLYERYSSFNTLLLKHTLNVYFFSQMTNPHYYYSVHPCEIHFIMHMVNFHNCFVAEQCKLTY